jgi:hypothetical protein
MTRQKRTELRRQRSAAKRAEAAATVPQMLAREQQLRDDLDRLLQRGAALGQHAAYDAALGQKRKEVAGLSTALKKELESTMELSLRADVDLVPELSPNGESNPLAARQNCEAAQLALDRAIALRDRLLPEMATFAEFLADRADLGTQPVDREALAAGIDDMQERADAIDAGVEWHRRRLVELRARVAAALPRRID